jgi:hypothetical protein
MVLDQLKRDGIASDGLLLAYQEFCIHLLKAPVCKKDSAAGSQELKARDRIVQSFNERAARSGGGVLPISLEASRDTAHDRAVIDKEEPALAYPPELWNAYLAFRPFVQNPALATEKPQDLGDATANFMRHWREWDPFAQNHDFRAADTKVALLVDLVGMNMPGLRERIVPGLTSYLSGHVLKKEQPEIWMSYITTLISFATGGKSLGMQLPPDPAMLEALRKAPDQSIQLLALVP